MSLDAKPIVILFADDDKDDQLMVQEGFEDSHLANELHFVEDGEELLDYLYRRGKYTDASLSPKPDIILLDLNMPKLDGRQALQTIKEDNTLKRIPVVVLTTSKAEEDIVRTYNIGCNSYITKPVTFEGMVKVVRELESYWFQIVKLPPRLNGD